MSDNEFNEVDSGASDTIPIQAGALKKGGHVCIKGKPCKIINLSTSKTGKHGHAKVNIVGVDIFTGKKLEDMCPSTHNTNVPIVKRQDYQLIDIEDDYCSFMLEDGSTKDDLKLPEGELGSDIQKALDLGEDDIFCNVVSAMGIDQIMSFSTKKVV